MTQSKYNSPPKVNSPEFNDWLLEIHLRQAVDPGNSIATTIAELVVDYNRLLTNLRVAGLIK